MVLAVTPVVIVSNIPGVVVYDLIVRLNKGVVDDLQIAVHHCDSHQLQTVCGVALKTGQEPRLTEHTLS